MKHSSLQTGQSADRMRLHPTPSSSGVIRRIDLPPSSALSQQTHRQPSPCGLRRMVCRNYSLHRNEPDAIHRLLTVCFTKAQSAIPCAEEPPTVKSINSSPSATTSCIQCSFLRPDALYRPDGAACHCHRAAPGLKPCFLGAVCGVDGVRHSRQSFITE